MTTGRRFFRKMTVVFAAFAVSATSVMPAEASPVDPSTTVAAPAEETSTTIPGSTETTVLPLTTDSNNENGIDEPPTATETSDSGEFPAGNIGMNKSGADLTAAASMVGPAIPGFVYMGIVYVTNIGNQDAGEKSPVSFSLTSVPKYVKLLDVQPVIDADSPVGEKGWNCQGLQCVYVEKTDTGIKNALLRSSVTAQADLRFDIAADAIIPVSPVDLLDDIKKKSTSGDLQAFNAAMKQVAHVSVLANESGDVNTTNNEGVVQLNGVQQDSGVQAGSTKSVISAHNGNGRGFAGVYIESKIKGPVFPGGPFHMELRFLPTGSETQSGKIKFSDVVAPALGLTKVKVSGTGWSCDSTSSPTSCSRTGEDIKAGLFTEPLIVDARVGKSAPVADKPVAWVVTSNSATKLDATPIEGKQTLSVSVRPAPEPDLAVRLVPRDGASSISPPGSLTVDALVRSVYGNGEDVHLRFSMRKGLAFKGLDPNTVGWTCTSATPDESAGEGSSAQDCVKAEMESDEPETVSIIVGTTQDTEAGPAQVIAEISAANEASKYKAGNRVAHTLVIQPLPAAMPAIIFTRPDEKGATQAVTDGSATKILIGKDTSYAFSVKNLGSKALPAASVIRFEQFVDATAIFGGTAFPVAGGYAANLESQKIDTSTPGKWVCIRGTGSAPKIDVPADAANVAAELTSPTTVASNESAKVASQPKKVGPAIRCEIKTTSPLAPDASTPVLNLTVRVSDNAKVGTPEWPVFASMVSVPQAPIARFGMTIAISELIADLVPSFIVPSGPRPGGNAVATLSLKNSGNADASSQFLVVPGIKNARITDIKGDSWKCARLGTALAAGFTICSRSTVLKAGTDSPSVSIKYRSTNKKSNKIDLQAASLVSTSRNLIAGRGSKLPVALRPALSFTVTGPPTIVDQLVDVKGNRIPSTILFSTLGNGDGATYSWKQLCTTTEDVKASDGECKAVTPVAKWFEDAPSTGPTATLITPVVSAATTLLFDVTATEDDSSATVRASVVVVPLMTVNGPTGKSASGSGSSVLHRVPGQITGSVRALSATAPTSGTGDARYTTTSDTGVSVNGNVFGGTTLTVAQGASVSLTASASGVGAITYAWSQAAGPNPSVLASASTSVATLSFVAPAANITVALRVEATDSRGLKASDIITVVVGTGGIAAVAATITEGDGPIVVDTASAFTLNATGTGTGAITYAWTQVSGTTLTLTNATSAAVTVPATGVAGMATLLVTATDASGAKASDQIVLQLAPSGAPAPLCDFIAAISGKSLTRVQATIDAIGIGGIDLTKFTASSASCDEASKVTFSDAGFSLGRYLTVSGASGSVSASGLTIRTARFTGPEDWGSPEFGIAATDAVGLFIPFSRASVSIGAFEGQIIAKSMPFLKLPNGYAASSKLSFSVDAEGTKTVSLEAVATGTAVDGKTPTARVFGSVATNGTFALEGSMTDVVKLFGVGVNFTGTVSKADPTEDATVSLSGSLEGPVTLTSGVVLNGLTAERDAEGAVTGSGTVTVGAAPSALILTANLSYTDAANHSLDVTATAPNGTWTPAKDVVIPLASASGSYTMKDGARDIAIKVVGSDSTPISGLAIKAPTIDATASCAPGASCAVKVNLNADAEITLGSTATTGKLSGSFDIAAKSGSFTASVGTIPVVSGLSLSSASLKIDSTKVGAADQATTITLSGSAVVFEKTVTATAQFSKAGILLTAELPELAIFGASGPVFKPGQLSWSSGPLTGFTPKVPSLPNIKPINLLAKVPRLNAAIALPSQVKDFASSVIGAAGDIALDGDINFATGQFSLAASLSSESIDASGSISRAKTGDPYKYNLTGTVKKPIVLNSSVTLKTLAYAFGNDVAGGPVKFVGTGGVDVKLPDSTVLSVNGELNYTSSTSYSMSITVGAAATSFTVNGGEALSLGTATGSFVRDATGTTLNVAMSSSATWKPVSGLSVSGVAATAALTCATGATCVPTFNVTGTLGFDLGIPGLNTAVLTGSLDATGFKFSAQFNDLIFSSTGDIKLTAPTLSLTIPAKSSTSKSEAKLSGNFSMFGATVAGSISFSSAGVLLLGTVPAFKFTGSDVGFDGGQFAWLLKAPTSITWTPTVPNLTLPAVTLPVGTPKLRLSMPIPDAVKQLSAAGSQAPGSVTISGDMTLATGGFSLAASYLSTALDASGSVSRPDKATPLTYSLSVAVKDPVTVVDGVAVNTLNMSISNATGSAIVNGSGQITISTPTDPITLGFGLNYTSSTNYSFNIAVSPGNTTSWTPFAGVTVPLGNISGSMARNGDTKTFSASFKSSSDWVPFPGAKIAEPGVSIEGTCTTGSPCVLAFKASGKVSVDVGGGWQGPAVLSGSFGKTESSLTATFPDITITTGVAIKAPSLSLKYSTTTGISGTISGSADILGTSLSMSATFSSQGVVVAGSLNDWTPIPGVTLKSTTFAYSTYALANVELAAAPALGKVTLAAGKPSLIAGFSVPSWLRDLLKQPTLTVVPVNIPLSDLAGGKLPTIKIMLPTPDNWYMYKSGTSSMRFTALGFEISGSPAPSMSLIGQTEMLTGAVNETPIPLEMRGTITTTSISLSLSLGLDKTTGNPFAWKNAFGVTDLTLTEAAIQIGITLTAPIPLPSLGIAATAQLPASWRSSLNMDAGVAVRLVANIDITQPCFQLQAGTLGADNRTISSGTAKVLSVAGGALTATYLNLTIAPLGCTVGNVVVEPGISAGFTGTVLGTSVAVSARIGSNPFSLEANLAIGAFTVGPVQLDETRLGVKISPTENYVSFAGGVTIGATKVKVEGKAGTNLTDGAFIDLTGSIENLVIVSNALEIKNANIKMNLKPAKGFASIKADGSFNLLGTQSTVTLDMQMSNYQLQKLDATFNGGITVGTFVVNGKFDIAYTKGTAPLVNFNATASVSGYQLGTVTGSIDGNQATVVGTVQVGGVFSAQVSGQIVWKAATGINVTNRAGQLVAATTGDFRFAATNLSMNLGGFTATGNVILGRASGVVYGDFNATFVIGSGDVGGTVSLAGSFSSDGNFSFSGSAKLTLVAFTADVTVSGSKAGSAWNFAMTASLTVMGAVKVDFAGNFSRTVATATKPAATLFTMSGKASLSAAGIAGSSAEFRISNVPGQAGLFASVAVNISGISGSGSLWIGADGTFDTTLGVSVNLAGVSAGGNLKVGNVAWVNGVRTRGTSYFQIDAWLSLAGVSFRMYGYINGDGSFKFTAAAGPWTWGVYINAGFVQLSFGSSFNASLTISSSAPYLAVSIGGSAWLDWSWPACWWGGWHNTVLYCGWGGWSRAFNAGMGFNTNPGNVWINIWGYGFTLR